MCEVNLQPVIQAEALARGAALPLCLRIAFSTLSTSKQSNILKETQRHADNTSKMLLILICVCICVKFLNVASKNEHSWFQHNDAQGS